MPLIKGTGKKVLAENIREFHTGETYAKTAARHGKAVADKQAIAAAYSQQRQSRGLKSRRKRGIKK